MPTGTKKKPTRSKDQAREERNRRRREQRAAKRAAALANETAIAPELATAPTEPAPHWSWQAPGPQVADHAPRPVGHPGELKTPVALPAALESGLELVDVPPPASPPAVLRRLPEPAESAVVAVPPPTPSSRPRAKAPALAGEALARVTRLFAAFRRANLAAYQGTDPDEFQAFCRRSSREGRRLGAVSYRVGAWDPAAQTLVLDMRPVAGWIATEVVVAASAVVAAEGIPFEEGAMRLTLRLGNPPAVAQDYDRTDPNYAADDDFDDTTAIETDDISEGEEDE